MSRVDRPRRRDGGDRSERRAQANVLGVALLLGVTVASLGVLAAGVGTVIEAETARADATRVATGMDEALRPVAATGPERGRLGFVDGQLRVESRTLRVLDDATTVATREVDALVFEAGDRRAAFVAGAVIRGRPGTAAMRSRPPVVDGEGVLVVGSAELNATSTAIGGSGRTTATLRTDVRHDRRGLGEGNYSVAVETETPGPWERYFRERGADVRREDYDGDGVESVVADYDGRRVAYLVVHDMRLRLEVSRG